MIGLFITIINMNIAASIVAIAVMLVRILLKRTPKFFSYALWVVVFLRLVCPFSFESSTSLMPANMEIIQPNTIATPSPNVDIDIIDDAANHIVDKASLPQDYSGSANPLQTVLSISAYVWLSGAALLVIYTIASYILINRRVFDATLQDGNVYVTDKIPTACILGLVHPKIYIPTTVNDEELDYILQHEHVHIRRRDYLIKPLAFLVLSLT